MASTNHSAYPAFKDEIPQLLHFIKVWETALKSTDKAPDTDRGRLAYLNIELGLRHCELARLYHKNDELINADRAYGQAESYFSYGADHLRAVGDTAYRATVLGYWGMAKFERGRRKQGRTMIRDATRQFRALETPDFEREEAHLLNIDAPTSWLARRFILLPRFIHVVLQSGASKHH